MRIILILVMFSFIISCEKTKSDKYEEQLLSELGWLYEANPHHDLEKAVRVKDHRFIGFNGNGVYVPTLNRDCINDNDVGIRFIGGSGHTVVGYEHAKLVALAQLYASTYNEHLYYYLNENYGFACKNT